MLILLLLRFLVFSYGSIPTGLNQVFKSLEYQDITLFAVESADPSVCNKLVDDKIGHPEHPKAACLQAVPEPISIRKMCAAASMSSEDSCIYEAAIKSGNPLICGYDNKCLNDVAVKVNDSLTKNKSIHACDFISSIKGTLKYPDITRISCYHEINYY